MGRVSPYERTPCEREVRDYINREKSVAPCAHHITINNNVVPGSDGTVPYHVFARGGGGGHSIVEMEWKKKSQRME